MSLAVLLGTTETELLREIRSLKNDVVLIFCREHLYVRST
jgi:hypothetical protein